MRLEHYRETSRELKGLDSRELTRRNRRPPSNDDLTNFHLLDPIHSRTIMDHCRMFYIETFIVSWLIDVIPFNSFYIGRAHFLNVFGILRQFTLAILSHLRQIQSMNKLFYRTLVSLILQGFWHLVKINQDFWNRSLKVT